MSTNAVGQLTTNYTPDVANTDKNKFAHLVSIASDNIISTGDTHPVSKNEDKTLLERTVTVPSKQKIARMGSENYGKFRDFFVSLGQTIVHFFGDTPPIPSTPSNSRTVKVVTNKE